MPTTIQAESPSGRPVTLKASANGLLLTEGANTDGNASLASIDGKLPAQGVPGMLPVDVLGTPGTPIPDVAVNSTVVTMNNSVSAVFGSARRVSVVVTAAMRYTLTSGPPSQAPTGTLGNLLLAGERIDFDLPATTPVLTVVRATGAGITAADGICNITRIG